MDDTICAGNSTLYACIGGGTAGYKIGNNCYICDSAFLINLGGCDEAAHGAANDCKGINITSMIYHYNNGCVTCIDQF